MFVKDTQGNHVRCPKCNSADVRYSDSYRIMDLFRWFSGQHSVRCRNCRERFYAETDEAANSMWVKR